MDDLTIYDEKVFEELKKCQESSYYFVTKYLVVDGKRFKTLLTEKQFNELAERVVSGEHKIIGKKH